MKKQNIIKYSFLIIFVMIISFCFNLNVSADDYGIFVNGELKAGSGSTTIDYTGNINDTINLSFKAPGPTDNSDSNYYSSESSAVCLKALADTGKDATVDLGLSDDETIIIGECNDPINFNTDAENTISFNPQYVGNYRLEIVVGRISMNQGSSSVMVRSTLILTIKINDDTTDDGTTTEIVDCEGVLGSIDDNKDPAFWLFKAFRFIQILGPILVIIFSTIDFLTVFFSNNKDSMNNMFTKSLKRLACAVLLFFLPLLIKLLLQIFDIVSGTCGIG